MKRKIETKPKRSFARQIINAFIGIFAIIVTVLILFFGFSQTNTFREYLRNEITTQINSSLQGKLSIEKIEGSVLTSLILRNTNLIFGADTILAAEKISLKLKPHKVLFDIIYVREILIENISLNLLANEAGQWNIDRALSSAQPAETITTPETIVDTTASPFPYIIQVADLSINNLNLVKKTFENLEKKTTYNIINWDDVEISNLSLSAALNLDLPSSDITLKIHDLAGSFNLNTFNLNHFSTLVRLTKNFAAVEDLIIKTDSSDISLNARLEGLNLFDSVEMRQFEFFPLKVELEASPFCFDDLTSFIGATDILKGSPRFNLSASGMFGNININRLEMEFMNTRLNLSGSVQKLHTPEFLFIDAELKNSTILQTDASNLLPSIGIPRFEGLLFKTFDAKFRGQPNNFYSEIHGQLPRGSIDATAELNFQKTPFLYNVNFNTKQLNFKPLFNTLTDVNSSGSIKGRGTSPENLKSDIQLYIHDSRINLFDIDSLVVNSRAENMAITTRLFAKLDEGVFDINSALDFSNGDKASYKFNGDVNKFNLELVSLDSNLTSDINFNFDLEGEDLSFNNTRGTYLITLGPSKIEERQIDSSKIQLMLDFTDPFNRNIDLNSDMLVMNMDGKFEFGDLITLVDYESGLVADLIVDKIKNLNPLSVIVDSSKVQIKKERLSNIVYQDISTNTEFQFNNSALTDFILGGEKLNLQGTGNIKIENDTSDFSISADINLDNFTRVSDGNPLYLSDFEFHIDLNRNNLLREFADLFASFSVTGKRLYTGTEFDNIEADLIFNQDKMFFSLFGEIDTTLRAEVEGDIMLSDSTKLINLNRLFVDYQDLGWANPDTINMIFTERSFELKNFELDYNLSKLKLDGTIFNFGEQNFFLSIENITSDVIRKYFSFLDDEYFKARVNIHSAIKGNLNSPEIILTFVADSVGYRNRIFGSIYCNMDYADQVLISEFSFLDNLNNLKNPKLLSNLKLPINLDLDARGERLLTDQELEINIKSNNLDLSEFGNTLPIIRSQTGKVLADIKITGTYNALKYNGYLKIPESSFNLRFNNLDYNFSTNLIFSNSNVQISNLQLSNGNDTRYKGTINGTGLMDFDGFVPKNLALSMNGDLAIMGQKSKLQTPLFYGDLLVSTDGDLKFNYNENKSSLAGKILINEADLVYLTKQETLAGDPNELIYTIMVDSSKIDTEELRFKELFATDNRTGLNQFDVPNFDYNLDLTIVKDARLVFIMPEVINQRLIVEATGGFKYANIDGVPRAQGEIRLLNGSQLEFFKNFDASGSLRFESELTNPYLDISALYTSNYSEPESDNIEQVAVGIRINGPLSQLAQNFTSQSGNFKIYKGSDNIQNRIPDNTKDFSDAVTFLVVNKFKKDLSRNDQKLTNDLAASATYTLAGTFLSNLVNSSVGGVINNIQVNQIDSGTKDDSFFSGLSNNLAYTLSGRYKNLKYSLGGSAKDNFKPNQANLKIEYLFNPNFSARFERKSSVGYNYEVSERINEFALKYKFEF